jgi:hypothetical protein
VVAGLQATYSMMFCRRFVRFIRNSLESGNHVPGDMPYT